MNISKEEIQVELEELEQLINTVTEKARDISQLHESMQTLDIYMAPHMDSWASSENQPGSVAYMKKVLKEYDDEMQWRQF